MVIEEKYILVKHANYSAEYIDNAPVYERRFLLELLKKELMESKQQQEKAARKAKSSTSSKPRRRR